MSEYTPSVEDMENRYVLWSLSLEGFPLAYREAGAERMRAEFRRGLARVRREAKAEALREAAENVDMEALADAWTRGAVTRLSVTNAVAEVLMSLRSRAAEYETGDQS